MRKFIALFSALIMFLALSACDASSHRDIEQDAASFVGVVSTTKATTTTTKTQSSTATPAPKSTTTTQSAPSAQTNTTQTPPAAQTNTAAQATPAAQTNTATQSGTAAQPAVGVGGAGTGNASGEASGASEEPPAA